MNIKRLCRYMLMYLGTQYKMFLYGDSYVAGPNTKLLYDASIENLQDNQHAITLGANNLIRGHLLVWKHGGRIQIGDHSFVGPGSQIWSMSSVVIGNRVLISHGVNITDSNAHSKVPQERHRHYRSIVENGHPRDAEILGDVVSQPIVIEDDVWISFGCTILKGVRIGARSIIAAGTVITKDVPPDSLCMSNHKLEIRPLNENNLNGIKL